MNPEDQQTQQAAQPATPPPVTLDFTQAQPVTSAATPPTSGVTLDFSKAQPLPSAVPDSLHITSSDNPVLSGLKRVNAVGAGIGDGLLDTLNGGAEFLGLPHATLQERQRQLEQQNAENPYLNTTGKIADGLAEFVSGDETLKGLAWSERLLKTAKVAQVLETSPRLMKAAQIGFAALRSGTVQSVLGTAKSGDAKTGAEEGLSAGLFTGALGAGGETIKAIRSALDANGIQKPLTDGIRSILSDVAEKTGLSAPDAPSIRDAAQQLSDGLEARASSMYQTLDNISGGQAQRFRDAAENVSSKLRGIVGLDDDKEAELVKKQTEIDTAHKAMLAKLAEQGHDPNLLQQADAVWTQQAALTDLNNAVRQSTSGLRPELATGSTGATTPESVNPKTLFTKINRLNDRGRLAQAIGQDNANALLQHVDSAYVQAQKIAQRNAWVGKLAKAAGVTTLGAAGLHFAHDLLGGGQ